MKTTINELRCFISTNFTVQNAKRFGSILLPFLALHSKTSTIASIGTSFSSCYTLWNAPPEQATTGRKWGIAVYCVSPFALGILFPAHKQRISDIMCFANHLLAGKDKTTTLLQIINQVIHLSSAHKKTPCRIVLSFLSQAAIELFQAYKHYEESNTPDKENKTPEMIASFLLAGIQLYKVANCLQPNLGLSKAPKIEPQQQVKIEDKPAELISETPATQLSTQGVSASETANLNNTPLKQITQGEWESLYNKYISKVTVNAPTTQLNALLKTHGFSQELHEIDFSKNSLWNNISFDGLSCYNCNFSNVRFHNASFDNFTASHCQFNGSTLDSVKISNSKFIACDLSGLSMHLWLSASDNTVEDCIGNASLIAPPTIATPEIKPQNIPELDQDNLPKDLKQLTQSDWEGLYNKYLSAVLTNAPKTHLYTLLKTHGFSQELHSIDFSKNSLLANLSFEGISCTNCNFSKVYFMNVEFLKFAAIDCSFVESTLSGVRFMDAKIFRCDWSGYQNLDPLSFGGSTTVLECKNFYEITHAPSDIQDQNSASEKPDDLKDIELTFKNPSCPLPSLDHELSGDLEAKIEARRFKIVNANGEECDFGSYFHGFGTSLVKNANLHFRKVVLDNGAKCIELSFRVNHIYHERLRKMIKEFRKLEDDTKQTFARQYQSQGVRIDRKASYVLGKLKLDEESASKVALEGLGSLTVGSEDYYNLKDHVRVILSEGATIDSFNYFLSIFGLEDALKKSTEEDLEKIKLGILFRTFFPAQSCFFEIDGSCFDLSAEQLKEKMIAEVPKMGKIMQTHLVEKHELFPGFVRFGVAVDQKAYDLGARALTTALTSLNASVSYDKDLSGTLADTGLDQVANILKNGLLSQEMREKNGISSGGLNDEDSYMNGGAASVYTQMITNKDILDRKKVGSFGYSSPVRLYCSLEALNQGSYQDFFDNFGSRDREGHCVRPTIFEFIKKEPSNFGGHEIMIPDRILPGFVKAISVQSQTIKQQIVARMRVENLIKADQDGQETFNGIPIDEFIRTEDYLSPDLVKRCFPQSPVKAG